MDELEEEYLPILCRLRLRSLDERVTRCVPDALLMVDSRRQMLCLRFRDFRDLYDLTEFSLSEDEEFVTFDRDEYTRLLFWLRSEINELTAKG